MGEEPKETSRRYATRSVLVLEKIFSMFGVFNEQPQPKGLAGKLQGKLDEKRILWNVLRPKVIATISNKNPKEIEDAVKIISELISWILEKPQVQTDGHD